MTGRLVEPTDYASFARRIVRSFGERVAAADPEALALFVELRQQVDAAETVAMAGLIAEGYSYGQLARPLGITRQAAFQRVKTAQRKAAQP